MSIMMKNPVRMVLGVYEAIIGRGYDDGGLLVL